MEERVWTWVGRMMGVLLIACAGAIPAVAISECRASRIADPAVAEGAARAWLSKHSTEGTATCRHTIADRYLCDVMTPARPPFRLVCEHGETCWLDANWGNAD